MKILLIAPYFFPKNYGGAPYVYKEIINLSKNTFHVFTDLDVSMINDIRLYDKKSNFSIVRTEDLIFKNKSTNKLKNYLRLFFHIISTSFSYIKNLFLLNPDIVICGQVYEVGWLCTLNRLFKIKTICYVHGEELTMRRPEGLWSRLKTFFSERIIKNSIGIIAVSEYTKNIINNKFNRIENVFIVNNGVDLKKFYQNTKNGNLEEMYKIKNCRVLLSLARLVPKKGIDLVINSLPEILLDFPDVKLLVGGTGPDRSRLEFLSEQCGAKDCVIFAGFVDDDALNDFINLGDIFVMPNRNVDGDTEGFGLVFLQASACGLPVIGGNAGGTSDAIQNGKSGYLVDGSSKEEFVARVLQIFRNDIERKGMSEFSRQWVAAECSWESRVKQFDDIINMLVGKSQ